MDVKECLEKGLLKKDKPNIEKAEMSLEISSSKLERARQLFQLGILDMTQVSCYSAMFHASRALLFRDGFKEKSHFALYLYLKEKYSDKIEPKFLNEFNILRLDRHEIFYGLEETELDKESTGNAIVLAEKFIKNIERIL